MAAMALGLSGLCAFGAVVWAESSLARREGTEVNDLAPYGDELRALDRYGNSPGPGDFVEPNVPGGYQRLSPDGRYIAVTQSFAPDGAFLLGLVWDRPHIHTVNVWDRAVAKLTPVISIKEADPASGIAYRYTWSRDSRALLLYGSGRLPDDYDKVISLCLVYLPRTDQLMRLRKCPPLW